MDWTVSDLMAKVIQITTGMGKEKLQKREAQ